MASDDDWDEWRDGSDPKQLERAWREAAEDLPARWSIAGVQRLRGPYQWMATATGPGPHATLNGYGDRPAIALDDLRDRLREVKSEALKKKLPRPF